MERENRRIINMLKEENDQLCSRINVLEDDCERLKERNKDLAIEILMEEIEKKLRQLKRSVM